MSGRLGALEVGNIYSTGSGIDFVSLRSTSVRRGLLSQAVRSFRILPPNSGGRVCYLISTGGPGIIHDRSDGSHKGMTPQRLMKFYGEALSQYDAIVVVSCNAGQKFCGELAQLMPGKVVVGSTRALAHSSTSPFLRVNAQSHKPEIPAAWVPITERRRPRFKATRFDSSTGKTEINWYDFRPHSRQGVVRSWLKPLLAGQQESLAFPMNVLAQGPKLADQNTWVAGRAAATKQTLH